MAAPAAMMKSKSEPRSTTSMSLSANEAQGVGSPVRQSSDLSYMHRPPTIMPNYGKKGRGGLKLKTNVPRVLLYDNVTQQTMLNVQLSGIQSQRYKISRELQMQMKSFLVRKQIKDKALQKLTKVPHDDDYPQFEEEHYGQWVEHDDQGAPMTHLSLPNIRNNNGGGPSPRRSKRKGVKQRPGLRNEAWTGQRTNGYRGVSDSEDHYDVALPIINVNHASLATPKTNGSAHNTSTAHHFLPHKRVGFRFEKTPAGTTRIFHVLPATSDEVEDNGAEITTGFVMDTEAEIGAIEAANQPDVPDILPEMKQSSKNYHPVPALSPNSYFKDGRLRRPFKTKPAFDHRFEMLQQLLIRQDPPNEGFTELSPSFSRRYPLDDLGEKLAYLRLRKRSSVADSDFDKQSLTSEGAMPFSSEEHSYDSENETNMSSRDSHINSPRGKFSHH